MLGAGVLLGGAGDIGAHPAIAGGGVEFDKAGLDAAVGGGDLLRLSKVGAERGLAIARD